MSYERLRKCKGILSAAGPTPPILKFSILKYQDPLYRVQLKPVGEIYFKIHVKLMVGNLGLGSIKKNCMCDNFDRTQL